MDDRANPFSWRNFLRNHLPLLLALLYAGWVLFLMQDYLADPWRFDDDHQQHGLAFAALTNPEAFQDGFLANYSIDYQPRGYRALMQGICRIWDPLPAFKILGVCLLLCSMLLAWFLGRRLSNSWGGLLLLILFCRHGDLHNAVYSGLFRGCAPPILLLFTWWLSGSSQDRAWVSVVLAPLFYPPLWLVLAPAMGAISLWRIVRAPGEWKRITWIAALAGGVSLLCMMDYASKPEEIGAVYPFEEIQIMPEWQDGGRLPELPMQKASKIAKFYLERSLHGYEKGKRLVETFALDAYSKQISRVILLTGILLLVLMRCLPLWWSSLAVSSLLMFWLAYALKFELGWPNRYLSYPIPILFAILLPLVWGAALRCQGIPRFLGMTWTLTVSLVVLLGFPLAPEPSEHHTIRARTPEAQLVEFFRGEQGPVLVAGSPRDLDILPLMAGVETFVDYEHAHPIYRGFYEECVLRLADSMALTYAERLETAASMAQQHGITHLLIHTDLYRPDRPLRGIYQPFDDWLTKQRKHSVERPQTFRDQEPLQPVLRAERLFLYDLREPLPTDS